MTKEEIKKEFIDLYHSMPDEEKARLSWEVGGLYYIFTYSFIYAPELHDAALEQGEDFIDEVVDEIGELYYEEFPEEYEED